DIICWYLIKGKNGGATIHENLWLAVAQGYISINVHRYGRNIFHQVNSRTAGGCITFGCVEYFSVDSQFKCGLGAGYNNTCELLYFSVEGNIAKVLAEIGSAALRYLRRNGLKNGFKSDSGYLQF